MKKKNGFGSKFYLGVIATFLYAPIVYIIIFSFNSGKSLTKMSGFSLRWYESMFRDNNMMSALILTIVIAILATIISTVVGTITAVGLSKSNKVMKNMVEQVNQLPIMNPEIVTAISLLMLFSAVHMNLGFVTMLLAHVMFCIPYVILSVMPKLRSLNPNIAEAAMDLGATPWQALIKVIVPQCTPGIISGALIAFTMSFDDFVISYFVSGPGVSNISILVYSESRRVNPSINALSTLVVVIITVALILANIIPSVVRKKTGRDKEN